MTLHPISGKSYLLLFALLLVSAFSPAQTAVPVVLAPVPQLQFFDASGRPLSFGCVSTFQSQTTNPLATFSDFTGQVQNQNPVLLNAGGSANIWLQSGQAYSLVVKSFGGNNCALGQTLYTVDGVGGGASQLNTVVTPSGGSAAFTVQSQNQLFTLTLTANTAGQPVTFVGATAPALITFQITEDGAGAHTFSWPSNLIGAAPIDTTALHTTSQTFIWNGTTIMPVGSGFNSAGNTLLGNTVASLFNNIVYVDGISNKTIALAQASLAGKSGVIVTPPGYTETFTSGITLGNGTSQSIYLLSYAPILLTCNVSSGPCITVNDSSGMECSKGSWSLSSTPSLQTGCMLAPAATASFTDALTTGTGLIDYYIDGWTINNLLGGTKSGALLHIAGGGGRNTAFVSHMDLIWPTTGIGLLEDAGTVHLDTIEVEGDFSTGVRPCVVKPPTSTPIQDVRWTSVTCEHPGVGQRALEVNGNGVTNGVQGFRCFGCRIEGTTSADTTGQALIRDAVSVAFYSPYCATPGGNLSNPYCFEISQSGAGLTEDVAIYDAFNASGASTNLVTNLITSRNLNFHQGSYRYGSAATGTRLDGAITIDGGLTLNSGMAADGSGFKHKRFGASCTTGTTAGNSCTTAYTWTTAFADSSYTVSCNGVNAVNGPVWDVESKTAAGFTFRVYTIVALASSYGEVDCIAVHD